MKTNRIFIRSVAAACLTRMVLMMVGCDASATVTPHSHYTTVGKDPRRDTDLAKQDNLQAIDLLHQSKYTEAEKKLIAELEKKIQIS